MDSNRDCNDENDEAVLSFFIAADGIVGVNVSDNVSENNDSDNDVTDSENNDDDIDSINHGNDMHDDDRCFSSQNQMVWGDYHLEMAYSLETTGTTGTRLILTHYDESLFPDLVMNLEETQLPIALWEDAVDVVMFYDHKIVFCPKAGGEKRVYRGQLRALSEEIGLIMMCAISETFIVNIPTTPHVLRRNREDPTSSIDVFNCGSLDDLLNHEETVIVDAFGPGGRFHEIVENKASKKCIIEIARSHEWPEGGSHHTGSLWMTTNGKLYCGDKRIVSRAEIEPMDFCGSIFGRVGNVHPDTGSDINFKYGQDPFLVCTHLFLQDGDDMNDPDNPPQIIHVDAHVIDDNNQIIASGTGVTRDLLDRAFGVFKEKYLLPCGLGTKLNPDYIKELSDPNNITFTVLDHIISSAFVTSQSRVCPYHFPVVLIEVMAGETDQWIRLHLRELAHFVRKYHPDIADQILSEINNYADYGYNTPEEYLGHFIDYIDLTDVGLVERFGKQSVVHSFNNRFNTVSEIIADFTYTHVAAVDYHLSGPYVIKLGDCKIKIVDGGDKYLLTDSLDVNTFPTPSIAKIVSCLNGFDVDNLRNFIKNATGSSCYIDNKIRVIISDTIASNIKFESCFRSVHIHRQTLEESTPDILTELFTCQSWDKMSDSYHRFTPDEVPVPENGTLLSELHRVHILVNGSEIRRQWFRRWTEFASGTPSVVSHIPSEQRTFTEWLPRLQATEISNPQPPFMNRQPQFMNRQPQLLHHSQLHQSMARDREATQRNLQRLASECDITFSTRSSPDISFFPSEAERRMVNSYLNLWRQMSQSSPTASQIQSPTRSREDQDVGRSDSNCQVITDQQISTTNGGTTRFLDLIRQYQSSAASSEDQRVSLLIERFHEDALLARYRESVGRARDFARRVARKMNLEMSYENAYGHPPPPGYYDWVMDVEPVPRRNQSTVVEMTDD